QVEAYHRVLKSNFRSAHCGIELGHALICDCAYRYNCSRIAHGATQARRVVRGSAEDVLPIPVMDAHSIAVLNKRNSFLFGSDAYPLVTREYHADDPEEELFGLSYTRSRAADVKSGTAPQEDSIWEDAFCQALEQDEGTAGELDLATRDLDDTVASTGDLESILEYRYISKDSDKSDDEAGPAQKRLRLAFSGGIARPRLPSVSEEMSDLVLELAAVHGKDLGAIFRDYEVEYRKRKALDASCQLYQTSRELIGRFLTGVRKRRAAAEIEVEDPRGRDRMRALQEPTVDVAESLFEPNEAVMHPGVRISEPAVEAVPTNPYLVRAKSLLADPSLVEKLVESVKSATGRKPPTCTWCQLPIRTDTHPMRNHAGFSGPMTKTTGVRYCPVKYPDLAAFDKEILPTMLADRAAKKEKCFRCGLRYDDPQSEHRYHPKAV
ncbi:hypothetical protein FOZ62_007567, partial [Perkinsus olseni]